jgi:putative ATP-dependent endonuclease of OLD family
MRLTRVKVANHSRLADLDIEVRDHLVLVGPNDSGKSSLLRCLDLLLGASIPQIYSRLSASDLRNTDQALMIEATLGSFSKTDKALFPDEITVNPATGESSLRLLLIATTDSDGSLSIDRHAPEGGTGRQVTRDQLTGIGWTLLGATVASRELRDDRRSAVDDILQALDLGSEQESFGKLVDMLQERLDDSATLNTLKGRLADQLTKALPEPVAQDDLAFMPGAATSGDLLSDVRLRVKKDGNTKSLAEQSDGTRAMYYLALYDLVTEQASIVGIDEPEIHLHPSSQRSMARLLQGSSNQRVLATHSSNIVSAFPPDCIVTIRRGGEAVQTPADFLDNREKEAVRWWVHDRLEPLTAARIVAVEGLSDRILVQAAARALGKDLDQLGIAIVEAFGAGSMGIIHKLFGEPGFGIPMAILVDKDAAKATAKMLGVQETDLLSASVWVSQRDLEEEYVTALGPSASWAALTASGRFKKGALANSPAAASQTVENVAEFCRREKVLAAMSIAPHFTPGTLPASIGALLAQVAP